mmetsp:Transcript_33610/g.66429  ORF Transcript_33610/g.66429 Transcript_33610/m.66429 type:complete len:100 (+) Transcript_33610:246-545(+)
MGSLYAVFLFSMILFEIRTLVYTLQLNGQFEDRIGHIMLEKRMTNRWYKEFSVFHLTIDEPKMVCKISPKRNLSHKQACLLYVENVKDLLDRMNFSDFF